MNLSMEFPKIIAHRGASAYAPENTILAMQKAKALGSTMVEFDVVLSKDSVPIILHDERLNRTTNAKGYCYEHSLKELKQLDAGKWFSKSTAGEKIPTLAEILIALQELGLSANIEIKPTHHDASKLAAIVLAKVNEYWTDDVNKLIFSSFSPDILTALRDFSPDIQLGLLLHEWRDDWYDLVEKNRCLSIHLNKRIVTEKRIRLIKEKELALLCYVVNWRYQAKKLLAKGVDAVFSDYPDLLL